MASGEHHVEGAREPDASWQRLRSAHAGDHAEPRLREREAGVIGCHAEIAEERHLEAAPHRVAVHGGDADRAEGEQPTPHVAPPAHLPSDERTRRRAELGEIAPRREGASTAT